MKLLVPTLSHESGFVVEVAEESLEPGVYVRSSSEPFDPFDERLVWVKGKGPMTLLFGPHIQILRVSS